MLGALYLDFVVCVMFVKRCAIKGLSKPAKISTHRHSKPTATMSTQLQVTPTAVKVEDLDEPFLKQAEEVAIEFINLFSFDAEPEGSTKKAPYPPGRKQGEPELLSADEGQISHPELPASLPQLGEGQRSRFAQSDGHPAAASGPPPPPSGVPPSRAVSLTKSITLKGTTCI